MKTLLIRTVTALAFLFQLVAAPSAAWSAEPSGSPKPAGSIQGRVSDESGSPVAGALAEAFSCSDDTPAGSTVTDLHGDYLLTVANSGCYHLRFSGDNYQSSWHGTPALKGTATDVNLSGGELQSIDGQISDAGATISGTVKSSDGKPLEGAWVTAFSPGTLQNQPSVSDGRTDDKGGFSIRVHAGSYFLLFARNGYVTKLHGKSLQEPTAVAPAEGKSVDGITATLSRGGRITGNLADETGQGVSGLFVVAQPVAKTGLPVAGRSDAAGNFILDGVPTGKYKIAYGDRDNIYLLQWYPGKGSPDEATVVSVTAPATTSGIRAVLRQSGGISGRVTDAAGNAITEVTVTAEPVSRAGGYGGAVTDESGAFTVKGLPSGSYRLSFRATKGAYLPRYYRDGDNQEAARTVEVAAPQVTTGIDQILPEGTLLTGSVSDSSGAPLPGAMVTAYRSAVGDGKDEARYAFAEEDGTFSLPLGEGSYLVEARGSAEGFLPQWSGNSPTRKGATAVTISKQDGAKRVDFVLSRGGSISGTVRNRAGIGIAKVTVTASDATGDDQESAVSDEKGNYFIKGLSSGTFRVTGKGAAAGYTESRLPQPVLVSAPATVENIDLVLTQGGTISGKVTDQNGSPIAGVDVAAYDPVTWDEVASAYSEQDGSYRIGGLPENRYHIRFAKSDSPYAVQWHKGKVRREESTPVVVAGTGTVSGVDAALSSGFPLKGKVTDASGAPLHDAKVEIYGGSEDEPFDTAHTDSDGSYTVSALAAGSYRIRFSHDGYVPRWYGGNDRRTAASLTIRDKGPLPVSAALVKATGNFSGKLMNPEGQKIGQAWLTAIDASSGVAVADERICECSGKFDTPVPSGVYLLRVERHSQVVWYGAKRQDGALPLEAGEISGLEMVIEDDTVRVKQVAEKGSDTK